LQEIITRGRFLFADAPERLNVFRLVTGRANAQEIAQTLRRHVNNVRRDLGKLEDAGLIEVRRDSRSSLPVKKNGMPLYEKIPLARTVPLKYFLQSAQRPGRSIEPQAATKRQKRSRTSSLPDLTESAVLALCRSGEDQIAEFKAGGTEVRKTTREIGAMANTERGGYVLYGVADDGTIEGAGQSLQSFDQPIQNSIRSSIAPALTIRLLSIVVLGSTIIVVVVPPWNRTNVYHYEDRVLIRKGTNVFAARPEESRKLHSGRIVI
jgi:DNA-binding transcriptional ArsR family regulator